MKTNCLLPLLMLIFLSSISCSKTDSIDNKSKSTDKYRINLLHFSDYTVTDYEGKMRSGIKSIGLIEGKDYEIRKLSAQNDMTILYSLIDASKGNKADLIVTFHAQTLYAAINGIKDTPIIFSLVSNPYILGAGTSDSQHLPNVTGVYFIPPTEVLIKAISKCQPRIRRIGIMFHVGDLESTFQKDSIKEIANKYNIVVEAIGFTTVSEIQESVNLLFYKKVDGIMMNYDSYYDIIFPLLAKRSQKWNIPFFVYGDYEVLKSGPVIAASKHKVDAEKFFAEVIKKIRNGEKPGNIPFVSNKDSKTDIFINLKRAKELGVTIPEELKKEADKTISE